MTNKSLKSKKKKIAILNHGFIPAYRIRFYERLNELSEFEYTVIHGKPCNQSGHFEVNQNFNFPNYQIENKEFKSLGFPVIYQPVILHIFRARYDAVIVGDEVKFVANVVLFFLRKVLRKKVLVWGFGYHRIDVRPVSCWLAQWMRFGADMNLVYTAGGAAKLKSKGVSEKRIQILNNTLDMESAENAHAVVEKLDKDSILDELDLRGSDFTFLFIGRLSARKRIDEAIEFVKWLNSERIFGKVMLAILGDGPERESLERQALGCDFIRFYNNVYDPIEVAKFMRISVGVLMPGIVGLAVNHAFAHGRPIFTLADNLHSPEVEYIQNGKNGYIFEGGIKALENGLMKLLRDPQRLVQLQNNALKSRKSLNLDNMVKAFDEGVRKVLGS